MGKRRWHRKTAAALVDGAFHVLGRAASHLPMSRPALHGVEVDRGLRYLGGSDPAHLVDIYRPTDTAGSLPVVLYVHGGGFRALSRETHWLMGLAFARAGFLVFSVDYRLAPAHPYPAAISDVCAAYRWVTERAPTYGGDPRRIVVSGESAGANLVTSLTLCTTYEREEPWTRAAWDTGIVPRAAVPVCGIFQVSDTDRFRRRPHVRRFHAEVIADVEDVYLDGEGWCPLADPLVLLERGPTPDRPLPPFFLPVGGADPLAEDSIRLARALQRLGGEADFKIYPHQIHAFHALIWKTAARTCWRDMLSFVATRCADLPGEAGVAREPLSPGET